MSYFTKCGKVLGRRWGTLAFAVSSAILGLYWWKNDRMPTMGNIITGSNDDGPVFANPLPFTMPRIVDFAVGSLLFGVWVATANTVWKRGWRHFRVSEAKVGFLQGTALGAIGSILVVSWAGIPGVIIGSLFWGTLLMFWMYISIYDYENYDLLDGFGHQLTAVGTIWCLSTFINGVVPGAVYAGIALLIVAVIYLIPLLIIGIFVANTTERVLSRVFSYFLECDDDKCQNARLHK